MYHFELLGPEIFITCISICMFLDVTQSLTYIKYTGCFSCVVKCHFKQKHSSMGKVD